MPINDEEREYIIEEVLSLLKSPNREVVIEELKKRLDAPALGGDQVGAGKELDQVVLAVAQAVADILKGAAK